MNILEQLSHLVLIPKAELKSFIPTIPNRYKRYMIPKRNGSGERLIAQPAKAVKPIQRLCENILRKNGLPIHNAAMAYEKGTGIKLNAQQHMDNNYLLKMDFSNFFPSITPDVFFAVCSSHGLVFTEEDKGILTAILFWRAKRNCGLELSIGAPSSPYISNAVMYFFDERISEYCANKKITYTRYADDLTFSTNIKDSLFCIPQAVDEIIKKLGQSHLVTNKDKTVFASKKNNRHITGVTISNNGSLSIGRNRKKILRSMVHRYCLGLLSKEETLKLKGHLGFAKHIEPDFIVRLSKKYGSDIIISIQKTN
jgi:RNA-directed DNA polymerase